MKIFYYGIFIFSFLSIKAQGQSSHSDPDLQSLYRPLIQDKEQILRNLLKNISPEDAEKGFVAASPSRKDPPYYFHWPRDAALVMDPLISGYMKGWTTPDGGSLRPYIEKYISWVQKVQEKYGEAYLAEPKFNEDGSPYLGPWARPQYDGPALRALTLIRLSHFLIDQGEENYVRKNLYNQSALSPIKRDLEYICKTYHEPGFDLWEEVRGFHFYTLKVQNAALKKGALLARKLGDSGAADWYEKQVAIIEKGSLPAFYDTQNQVIRTHLFSSALERGKSINLDTSSLLAYLHTNSALDNPLLENTIKTLQSHFLDLYEINKKFEKGLLMGRYPDDEYQGGHPWILLSLALAEYNLKRGQHIEDVSQIVDAIRVIGGEKLELAEQIHKIENKNHSARDLSWSYAAYLRLILLAEERSAED